MFIRFDMMYERDGHTNRQTPHDDIGRACIPSRGKNDSVEIDSVLCTKSRAQLTLKCKLGLCFPHGMFRFSNRHVIDRQFFWS